MLVAYRYPEVGSTIDTHCIYHRAYAEGFTRCLPLIRPKGAKYGIASEGLIGALFLPNGFGNCGMSPRLAGRPILLTCTVGTSISGRISDAAVRRAKEERKGIWVPENRLRVV